MPNSTPAPYDAIADWYETEFLAAQGDSDPIGVDAAITTLLGTAPEGTGPACLEIGCGTGAHAATVRALGWTPVGVDLSSGMLAYAAGRLPVARADAEHLPIGTGALDAVIAVMVHTDMPGYARVVAEAARILRPGGRFVHVGVHPCFCGGFADRGDPAAAVIRPGYLDAGRWTTDSWTSNGVRDKVGATHWPLPDLLHMVTAAGLVLERFTEGGTPVPITFSLRASKPDA
ncbi:SAM-dependent methyltransferase [Catenulispora sp. GAS73]|uniref:class I SAM-dependent methyltransferase n=1 Tax=Catenulispora sp. GAS73 TaxID=3156269 RepID=UPI0035196F58